MINGQNIICITSKNFWTSLRTRNQRFMNMLSEAGNRVLYLGPIMHWLSRFEDDCINLFHKTKLVEVSQNLSVLIPPLLVPGGNARSAVANSINQFALKRIILHWQRRLGFENPILWSYTYAFPDIIGSFSEKVVIYDCTDEFSAWDGANPVFVQNLEERFLRKSSLVFTTARGLFDTKRKINPNTHFIPNGVDFELFFDVYKNEGVAIPSDMQFPRPIIGYVGTVKEWIDINLLAHIARKNPSWSIAIIGPIGIDISDTGLDKMDNVFLLGKKPPVIVPNYIKFFDVCLNPFDIHHPVTATVNPLKVYEYLAMGKPIVSVDMPEVRHLQDVIYIASSYEDFEDKIRTAIEANNSVMTSHRLAVAKDYSWDKLLEKISQKIEEKLLEKKIG